MRYIYRKVLLQILLVALNACFVAAGSEFSIVPFGSSWKVLPGTAEASVPARAWSTNAFDDSAWIASPLPVGYPSSDPSEYDPAGIEATIATTIPVGTQSVFCRKIFTCDPTVLATAKLTVHVDDGHVAWLNGVELGRFNVPDGELPFDTVALQSIETMDLTVDVPVSLLRLGPNANVLAVQVFNQTTESGDLLLDANLLASIDDVPPTIVRIVPEPGPKLSSLGTVEVWFSEAVQGVDPGDLLIDGKPATQIDMGLPGQYLFYVPQPTKGLVQVGFAPNSGITDLAAVPNAFAGSNWTYTLDTNMLRPTVVINELSAAGQNTLLEDGDYPDWIELYNYGTADVSLKGWSLTDNSRSLTKWRFPTNATIKAGGYVLVFASGKNRTNDLNHLHTNFQLDKDGEYLALVDANTNVVSDFSPTFPSQKFNVSYGLIRGTLDQYGFFASMSPKAANADSGSGFATKVEFSRPSGTFVSTAPFLLSLSTKLSNAAIYYNLGTNIPGTNSLRYTNAFLISTSTIVRARAFAPGLLPGPIDTRIYFGLASDTNVLNFQSDLPIVILHNFGAGSVPQSQPYQYLAFEVFEPKAGGLSSMLNTPDLAEEGGFHLRGSSTLTIAKGSYRLEVRDEFGNDKGVELGGLPKDSDWVLYAPNNFEPALYHNPLAHQLMRDMGAYGSRTRFCEVYLKDDAGAGLPISASDYNGIYVIEEKIKISKDRVDIDALQPEDVTEPAISGGYILAVDRPSGQAAHFTCNNDAAGTPINYVDPSGNTMANSARAPQVTWLRNYFNSFYSVLTNAQTWTNPVTGYAAFIDVQNWVNFHIHQVVTFNTDALRLSGYFYKPRNDKIKQGPSWDYDRSQGSADGYDFWPRTFRCSDYRTDFFTPVNSPNYPVPWWSILFKSPDFWQAWIDRYQEARLGPLSYTNIVAHIDQFAAQVQNAQKREQARWGFNPRSGTITQCGGTYTFSGGYAGEVAFTKFWYSNRLDFIDTNFLGRPTLSCLGGQVTNGFSVSLTDNSEKTGTILYYTLDGRDPRASGGSITSYALQWSGSPILVATNVRIAARAYNTNHSNLTGANNPQINSFWSGLVADTFYVQPPALRITEIMYHPPGLTLTNAGGGVTNIDGDCFEFLEIKNTGAADLNLLGAKIRGDVTFDFPSLVLAAGKSCVVVADTNAFALRYGTNNPNILIAGRYAGNLGNGGGRLVLTGPYGEPILDFNFKDCYPSTDGIGFSMAIVNENLPLTAWSDPLSWGPSRDLLGSPGHSNPTPPAIAPVVVNELLTHTDPPACDAVELYNPKANPVNIGGWFVTDTFKEPFRYRIPNNTMIGARGYLVLYASNTFGVANPAFGTSFQFGSHGEEVYLFSGDPATTNLTGYVHGFSFGAQFNGATFGRYLNSVSNELFVSQAWPTLGGPNAGPSVGPIVVSEIMYQPIGLLTNGTVVDNSQDEYIELLNILGEPVPLYDPAFPTNTWLLRDEVGYTFPASVVMPAGGRVLAVNFDPSDAAASNAFCLRYATAAKVPLFGPYSGKLNNDGGRIELMRPDHPEAPGTTDAGYVPYILVERISYDSKAPWPANGIGLGASLQRIYPQVFGNDPANWRAAVSTPGDDFVPIDTLPTITRQPRDQSVVGLRNYSASFTVVATGPGPLKYQWFWNNLPIYSGSDPTLEIPAVTPANAGSYHALVFNAAGVVSSTTNLLTVLTPVMITVAPTNSTVKPASNITFSVTATSPRPDPVTYQWRFNGNDIPNATNRTLTLSNASLADDGVYQVHVADAISYDLSQPVRLAVLVDPVPTLGPAGRIVRVGSSVEFPVQVVSDATLPMTFGLRRKNETSNLVMATLDQRAFSCTLTNMELKNAGYYYYLLSNAARVVYSPTSYVAVVQPPTNTTAVAGADVAFRAIIANPGMYYRPVPTYFQWQYNGASLERVTNLGATWSNTVIHATNVPFFYTTNTLLLSVVQPADLGLFSLQVTMVTNWPITPGIFTASLVIDSDGDGMPDVWELAHDLNPLDPLDALEDPDRDDLTNLQEYLRATDPNKSDLRMRITATGPTNIFLRFDALSNHSYSLLYQDLFKPGLDWILLTNLSDIPSNATITIFDLTPHPVQRYYRLNVP